MPLSEHEQRLLDQMEQALYSEDPKFASSLRGGGMRRIAPPNKRKLVLGLVGILAGIGLLLAGVITRLVPIGVAGFLVMLGSAYVILQGYRVQSQPGAASPRHGKRNASKGFMGKVEDRWQSRRENES